MTTLRELEARLLRCEQETSNEKDGNGKFIFRLENGDVHFWSTEPSRWVFRPVATVGEAHGVSFLCPKSYATNGGAKGTHSVYVFFAGSPYAGRNKEGKEVRWNVVSGSTIDDLSLKPSIQEQDEGMPADHQCNWHGFVGSSGVPPGSAA